MAGIQSRFNKWTPIESPMSRAIKISQRSADGAGAYVSHFRTDQKVKAVKNEEQE